MFLTLFRLRRWLFAKPTTWAGRRSSPRRFGRRLAIEELENRTVPTATTTTTAAVSLSFNQAFVATLYQGLLGRPADSAGLAYWSNQLDAGSSTSAVINGILNSPEYANDEIDGLYQQLLARSAGSNETAYWAAQKQAGATWQQIEANIAGSSEYYNDAGGNLNGYVTQLFQDFVHRLPNAGEMGYFQDLAAANVPRTGIAMAVIGSAEAEADVVDNDYRQILSRDADTTGAAYWESQLQQGVDQSTVLAGFVDSGEFAAQLQQFLNQNPSAASDALSFASAFVDADAKFGLTGYTTPSDSSLPGGGDLVFEPNVGQAGAGNFQFLAQGSDYTAFLTQDGPVLAFSATDPTTGDTESGSLEMQLVGANTNAAATGVDPLASTSNYFIGQNSADWLTNVPNDGGVEYQNVYSGINLVYQGTDRRLQHNFVVSPGANPDVIAFTFPGYTASIGNNGTLILVSQSTGTTLYATAPKMFQANGSSVTGGFVNLGNGEIGYQVGAYDHSQTLTIDPTLVYSTFVGGANNESATGAVGAAETPSFTQMAVDSSGDAYVVTTTSSTNFPTVSGSFAVTAVGPTNNIAVFKMNPSGTGLIYSTYSVPHGESHPDGWTCV
jgi:Domain of unknown function (DUF4214)